MEKLHENELMLLDNMIYLEGVKGDRTVGEIVDDMLDPEKDLLSSSCSPKDGSYPCKMDRKQWEGILRDMQKDNPTIGAVTP